MRFTSEDTSAYYSTSRIFSKSKKIKHFNLKFGFVISTKYILEILLSYMKNNQAVYIIVSNTNILQGKNPLNDAKIKLKSLSLNHFVKIRLFKFWGKEFLVKFF